MPSALDIKGQKYGRLTVLRRIIAPGSRNAMWECQCDCGGVTKAAAANLGKTKFSCGCLQSESATASLRVNRLARTDLHGMSGSPEWGAWSSIRRRCSDPKSPKYARYGGRGIKVCERWSVSFENFLADMGFRPSKHHSIDRINNDGGYEPGNCRWATRKTQGRNTSQNRWIVIDGRRLCVEDWCIFLGVKRNKVYEMVRTRDGRPAKFKSVDDAVRHLHSLTLSSA